MRGPHRRATSAICVLSSFFALAAVSQATAAPLSHAVVVLGWGGAGTRAVARFLDQSGVFIATGSGSDKCRVNPFSPELGDLACTRGINDPDTACSDTHLFFFFFGDRSNVCVVYARGGRIAYGVALRREREAQ